MARLGYCFGLAAFLHAAVAASFLKFNQSSKTWRMEAETVTCRSGFIDYQGWCVYKSPSALTYQGTVDICNEQGAYAPSIHSKDDLDFWSGYANVHDHFWTNAYCTSAGQLYAWLDGTPMDYLGPNNEMTNCQPMWGYHMHNNGYQKYEYDDTPAYAACAYNPLLVEPVDYCSCNPSSVYLDIVFVIDSSDDMTSNSVRDATATIQSTLYGLTFGTGHFQSNVAVVAYAESVQTVRDFGSFKTTKDISSLSIPYLGGNSDGMADAIKQASLMIENNGRDFTRGVVVLFSSSFDKRRESNINEAAKAFKDDGGVFITLDYSKGLGNDGLENLATPGFYVNDTSLSNPDLDADLLYAFCDANCFCKDVSQLPYNAPNSRGRDVPNGCYRVADFSSVYEAAKDNCEGQGGFVATVHDDDKNFFLLSLFPSKARYWIGLQKNGSNFEWADGSNDQITYWASGNPIAGQDCVYSQQQTGFNSNWFSAPCTDPLKNSMTYACQLRPCSSEYDCWA